LTEPALQTSRRARLWLAVGAALGVAVAAASLVRSGGSAPELVPARAADAGDAIAIVNGQPISREALARFVSAIARGRGRLELDRAEQQRVLARLIDEELLLQRGLSLGLERREPDVRRAIVAAVVDSITTEQMTEPTREDLEKYLRDNPAQFVRPGRVVIEAARIPLAQPSPAEARERADEAVRRARAGESLGPIGAELGAPIDPPLPAGPIGVDALRDRAGELVVQAVARLAPGETTDPVRTMDGYWIVRLVAREPDAPPALEDVYELVRQAWTQKEHDDRLADAMAALRKQAKIEILDPELRPE
jgi:parvulin-like peptidyl-prolyl cis-trans isomerase-like protein